jgi:hypothetical protein
MRMELPVTMLARPEPNDSGENEHMTDYGDVEDEPYKRLEVTVGVMVPFNWDAEAQTYRLVRDEVRTTAGGLFSDAEDGMWVPEYEEWFGPENADMDSAWTEAWNFVRSAVTDSGED